MAGGRSGGGDRTGRGGGLTADANLSILFTEVGFLDRPAAAARAGFGAVECWWPFDEPVPARRETQAFLDALDRAGTRLVALNFDAGDMAAGERGLLSLPGQSSRFRANVEIVVDLADRSGCRVLNALWGNRDPALASEAQDEVGLENLFFAASAAASVGATVVVEALNALETPRYPLTSTASALAVVERAREEGAANVAFLADLYHLGRMGEDLTASLRRAGGLIGHVQVADVPGRGEPGSGELGVDGLLGPLAAIGWDGFVGLEYRPSGSSEASFRWLDAALQRYGVGR